MPQNKALDTKGTRITYFGHSTFSLTTSSGQVGLIDPWVITNPMCPPSLRKLDRLDAIFLSHAHTDHLGDLLALAAQHHPKIVAIFETCLWIESKGFEQETAPMGKGGTQKIGDFEVTMTHAFHPTRSTTTACGWSGRHDEWAQDDPASSSSSDGWPRILSRLKTLIETGKTFKPH